MKKLHFSIAINAPREKVWSKMLDRESCMVRMAEFAGQDCVFRASCGLRGNSTIAYFTYEDCAIEEARAKQPGAKIQKRKTSMDGHISLLYDTEGNMIGLHSKK